MYKFYFLSAALLFVGHLYSFLWYHLYFNTNNLYQQSGKNCIVGHQCTDVINEIIFLFKLNAALMTGITFARNFVDDAFIHSWALYIAADGVSQSNYQKFLSNLVVKS